MATVTNFNVTTPGQLEEPVNDKLHMNKPSSSVEELIQDSIGHKLYPTQVIQAILASVPALFDGQQTFISVFTDALPKWHCLDPHGFATCQQRRHSSDISIICGDLPRGSWAWDKPHSSIISEWGLQCGSSLLTGLPTSSFFLGCLLGGFALATAGDSSLGRKNLLFLSSLFMSLAACASAFSPNLWVYCCLRFLSGLGRVSVVTTGLVLLTERVGKRWRSHLVILGLLSFAFGTLSVPGIAYAVRDTSSSWRALYLWTSVPGIVYSVVAYFFCYESPRWLLMQGRLSDAIAVLQKIGTPKPSNCQNNDNVNKLNGISSGLSSFKVLIERRWAVKRVLASMVIGLGVGIVYFGMFLGVGVLGFNLYLGATLNALLYIPSDLLTFLVWSRSCNRKVSMLGFCTISGVASVICAVIGRSNKQHLEGVQVGLELVSLFCACMAYNILLMYIIELFPTCVRNCATSLVRQAAIFGSIFDPILIWLGRKNELWSYGVFGIAIIPCGLLVLCLPETRGKSLCDTMEEQEWSDAGAVVATANTSTTTHTTV